MAAAVAIPAILGAGQIGLGVLGMDQASKQAKAERERGKFQQQIFNLNADAVEAQAGEVMQQGDQQAARYADSARSVTGKQSAAYAGQGVDVASGVTKNVQAETVQTAVRDMLTIKDNAWRQSWGMKQEASNLRRQGRLAAMGGNASANSTLVTGGLNFANSIISAGKTYAGR